MSSTERPKGSEPPPRRLAAWASVAGLGVLAACSPSPAPAPPPASAAAGASVPAPAPVPAPAAPARAEQGGRSAPGEGGEAPRPPKAAQRAAAAGPAATWDAWKRRAAHRLVEANPGRSYLGPVHEPLLGIPVLQIELNGDGSVRAIAVLRHAKSARDTTRLAEEAVRRAAPFGDVTHLPRPWRWTETFLFDEHRRFKPRTLDE